ncbi:MAG: SRPBCC family protein [Acidimicrobiales bacterium]
MTTSRVRLTGTVEIALPPEQAFMMFTPSGERIWADGWDPSFPSPAADETEPGTVFQAEHGGRASLWIVARRERDKSIAYVTTTPGERCGLVTVICESSANGTQATVSYDLTALGPGAEAGLGRFAANYPSFLGRWESSIAQATKTERPQAD